ncbi:SpoIIE family protein phosphatase [Planctomycetes bacterium K23_9]|uniref:Phosphoserine phosphatase RsbU n=1 Tax=Stieleria marina TaxID=1930275 RepID=A0A517NZU9_9BACT|nr:Phosphoserine phosphatase RsbU [Planctomycetes bacterium K23_9]
MAFLSTNTDDPNSAQRFELVESETVLGRHPDCHIVVDAGAVSRFHAKVLRKNKEFLLADAGSRNGTFLNGQQIQKEEPLREGDRIRISDVELMFHNEAVPEFARGGHDMTFDGSKFGVMLVDDESAEAEPLSSSSAKVEYRTSVDGLKMSATPEAKLEALIRINSNLSNVLSIDSVLPKVLESLFDIFPSADRGFIVMKNPDDTLTPRWVKTRKAQDETETVRISRTIIRHVMESGESILSLDALEDDRFDSSESIADFSIRSMMCAPLSDGEGNTFGALQIDSTQGRGQFREEDVDLLAGVATQAGIVINNARLHEQALTQREVEQDLKLAIEVQKAFLPQAPPDAPGFRVSSYYQAANHIGGDYFDYIHFNDGRVGIVVADVVGHGVAAAMFMAKLSAETRFCLANDDDLARAVERLNDRMSGVQVERFITFLLVVIDPNSEMIKIVNAGHMPPIVRHAADGKISEPGEEESGLPIAIDSGMDYETVSIPFLNGDLAVMYTDGINEAMDSDDEEFGMENVRALSQQAGNADEVTSRIVDAVLKHVGDAPPFDDMCLVIIERIAPPATVAPTTMETVDEDVIETSL